MMITSYTIPVDTSGSDGSATGEALSSSPVQGDVAAVHIAYDGQPATTDVTITTNSPAMDILAVADNATDGWHFPRQLADDTDGAALTGEYALLPVDDHIKVAVAGADDGGSVTVIVRVRR